MPAEMPAQMLPYMKSMKSSFLIDGIIVVEILLVPVALHLKRNMFHYRIGVLEHVLIGFHVGEFRQFAFAHVLGILVVLVILVILVDDDGRPTVLVLDLTVLDATEGIEELLGQWARLVTEAVTLASVEVVDIRDRTNHGCCTASTSLLEGLEFFLRNRTALYLHAQILSYLHQTLVSDRDIGYSAEAL